MTAAPAKQPCGSCPYRRDVPSGVWAADDRPTWEQPAAAFFCHQQDGRLCAGWVGTHDMVESLGLRMAMACGVIDRDDQRAVLDYESPVPLFGSGAEAATHGLADLDSPDDRAQRTIRRLARRQESRP